MENSANNATENNVTETEKKKLSGWKKEVFEWAKALIIAVVVAYLLNTFVLRLAKVDGNSMLPTLHHGEMLYVNRLMYEPEKGDIIIATPLGDPYVKRVIATEGDTVYIDFETGDVYVNDEVLEEDYISEPIKYNPAACAYINGFIREGNYSKENPIKIEEDKVFVLGDNRNGSRDSRDFGQVPKDKIIGQALFRFWPLNAIGGLD